MLEAAGVLGANGSLWTQLARYASAVRGSRDQAARRSWKALNSTPLPLGSFSSKAGADVIAPSGMMDGMVQVIRAALDAAGFAHTATMPYSAKFASALYGPFKAGTDSNPEVGLHATHQMDVANGREAMREIALDIEEGADMIIIKPALTCLDVIHAARSRFDVPIAAYHVSGESAMIRAAGQLGALDAERMMLESLVSIKRAGADMIITYSALDAIRLL